MDLRPGLSRWLTQSWYGRSKPRAWLVPLGALFGWLTRLRRRWIRPIHLPVRVVVVGNLAVGGSGKTPLVAWLATELKRAGLRVGIVLRGYGGDNTGVQRVGAKTPAREVGDEARWLATATGVAVAVSADRVAAVKALLAEQSLDIVLSDDGLQHYRLGRAAEIIAVDANRGLGNRALLPAGPLREAPSRLAEATAIVLKGEGEIELPRGVPSVRMHYRIEEAERLCDGIRKRLEDFRGQPLRALAAIAHPEAFFGALEAQGLQIERIALSDHAPVASTVQALGADRPLLMTTKDAVKLDHPPEHVWQVPVEVAFPTEDAHLLLSRVRGDEPTE